MPEHLAFLVPELGKGGAERAVANLASELARRGRKVSVLTLRAGGAYEAMLHPDVALINLDLASARRVIGPLAKAVRAYRIDAVFTVLFHLDLYTLVSRLIYGWKAKVILCFQNTPSVVARESASRSERLLMRLYRVLGRRADQFFAISQGVGDDAAEFFGIDTAAIRVISNPIVDPSAPPPSPIDLKALFDKPPASILVASGRLTKQKDYPTLLAALAQLRATRDVGLVVLGEGELKEALETRVAELNLTDHIRFVGFQTRPLDWMAGADLFVLSSLWEGLANVVVEALWVGLPVVSTDCPYGPAEILVGGQFGRLVPISDPAALAKAIDAELDQSRPAESLRARALDFSIGAIADRYDQSLFKVG